MAISQDEFETFAEDVHSGKVHLPEGTTFAVWDDNCQWIVVYLMYAMALITQYLVPVCILLLYMHGDLGDMTAICDDYPRDCGSVYMPDHQWHHQGDSDLHPYYGMPLTLSQISTCQLDWVECADSPGRAACYAEWGTVTTYNISGKMTPMTGKGFAAGLSEEAFNNSPAHFCGFFASLCPELAEIHSDAAGKIEVRLGCFFLFLFLLVSTPMGEIVSAAQGNFPESMLVVKYSYMTDGIFFYEISFMLNVFCFGNVLFLTYLLFITAPTVDNLLLNVLALQFLVDVDNIVCDAVLDDQTKERLIEKFCLCYIQNGEKNEHETELDESGLKFVIHYVLSIVVLFGVAIYYIGWLFPFVVTYCL